MCERRDRISVYFTMILLLYSEILDDSLFKKNIILSVFVNNLKEKEKLVGKPRKRDYDETFTWGKKCCWKNPGKGVMMKHFVPFSWPSHSNSSFE